jgi:hypothetical protein
MHGDLTAPEADEKTPYPPLRLHLDFYSCIGCTEQIAILTAEDWIDGVWNARDEYEGARKTSDEPIIKLPRFDRLRGVLNAAERAARDAAEPISPTLSGIVLLAAMLLGIYYYPQFPVILSLAGYRTLVTVQTDPPGQEVEIDYVRIITPHTFTWIANSEHRIQFEPRIRMHGQRYDFVRITPAPENVWSPSTAPMFNSHGMATIQAHAGNDRWGRLTRQLGISTYTLQYTPMNDSYSQLPFMPKALRDAPVPGKAERGQTYFASPSIGSMAPNGIATIMVTSSPPGLAVIVDGVRTVTPRSYRWQVGSYHTLLAPEGHQMLNRGNRSAPEYYGDGTWNSGASEGSNRVRINWSAIPFPSTYTAEFRRQSFP